MVRDEDKATSGVDGGKGSSSGDERSKGDGYKGSEKGYDWKGSDYAWKGKTWLFSREKGGLGAGTQAEL